MSDRDLVEAVRSERRRLATALVRGVTDRPLPRTGRAVAGGAALALLVAGAAAVAGAVAPRTPADWAEAGLVLPEGTSTVHVVAEGLPGPPGALHPVAGSLVARLLLGGDAAPVAVPAGTLATAGLGVEVGLAGAPATVPGPGDLASTWTACPDGTTPRPVTAAPDPAPLLLATVRAGARTWLLTASDAGAAVALPVEGAAAQRDALLAAVGAPPHAAAPEVDAAWLRLVPAGAPLGPSTLAVPGAGRSPSWGDDPGVRLPRGARLGDHLPDVRGGGAVLVAEGLRRLDPFAYAAYLAVSGSTGGPGARELPPVAAPGVADAPPPAATGWPTTLPSATGAPPCAVLHAATGTVRWAAPSGSSAADEVGAPALVSRGDASWLVVAGRRHELVGDAAARLGLDDAPATNVPATWLRALPRGVPLDPEAARCPPDPSSPTGSRCPAG